jgi:transcriptional regulator with XRE-family HTH domain
MEQWDPTEFQTVLRDFLERRGWSQNQLASATGISQAVINRWLQPIESVSPAGLVQPTDKTLRKLAPVIGLPEHVLMRMAGRLPGGMPDQPQHPPELATLIADIETGWYAADPARRRIGEDVVRSVFNVHGQRRPGRRRPGQSTSGPEAGEDTGAFGMLLSRN